MDILDTSTTMQFYQSVCEFVNALMPRLRAVEDSASSLLQQLSVRLTQQYPTEIPSQVPELLDSCQRIEVSGLAAECRDIEAHSLTITKANYNTIFSLYLLSRRETNTSLNTQLHTL